MTNEQAIAAIAATGIKSMSRADFYSLPSDQQLAVVQEEQLEAQARPTDYGAAALEALGFAAKLLAGAGAIESAVTIVTGVPSLIADVKGL